MKDNRRSSDSRRCQWCGKKKPKLYTHHLIPRWLDDSDSNNDTVEVCSGCHNSLESKFDNFIKRGSFYRPRKWKYYRNPEKERTRAREYARKYWRRKPIFNLKLYPYFVYRIVVWVNLKTHSVSIRGFIQVQRKYKKTRRLGPPRGFRIPCVNLQK